MGDFEHLLREARKGDHSAAERLLSIYAPLINRQSVIESRVDPDLRQQLVLEFILALIKFDGLAK